MISSPPFCLTRQSFRVIWLVGGSASASDVESVRLEVGKQITKRRPLQYRRRIKRVETRHKRHVTFPVFSIGLMLKLNQNKLKQLIQINVQSPNYNLFFLKIGGLTIIQMCRQCWWVLLLSPTISIIAKCAGTDVRGLKISYSFIAFKSNFGYSQIRFSGVSLCTYSLTWWCRRRNRCTEGRRPAWPKPAVSTEKYEAAARRESFAARHVHRPRIPPTWQFPKSWLGSREFSWGKMK